MGSHAVALLSPAKKCHHADPLFQTRSMMRWLIAKDQGGQWMRTVTWP